MLMITSLCVGIVPNYEPTVVTRPPPTHWSVVDVTLHCQWTSDIKRDVYHQEGRRWVGLNLGNLMMNYKFDQVHHHQPSQRLIKYLITFFTQTPHFVSIQQTWAVLFLLKDKYLPPRPDSHFSAY